MIILDEICLWWTFVLWGIRSTSGHFEPSQRQTSLWCCRGIAAFIWKKDFPWEKIPCFWPRRICYSKLERQMKAPARSSSDLCDKNETIQNNHSWANTIFSLILDLINTNMTDLIQSKAWVPALWMRRNANGSTIDYDMQHLWLVITSRENIKEFTCHPQDGLWWLARETKGKQIFCFNWTFGRLWCGFEKLMLCEKLLGNHEMEPTI